MHIDQGIPIPPPRYRNITQELARTILQLHTGDSVAVNDRWRAQYAYRVAKRSGFRIVTRKDEKGGWRIWRT